MIKARKCSRPADCTTHSSTMLVCVVVREGKCLCVCMCVCLRACLVFLCVQFSMRACCPTNFTTDLREARRLLISSTEGSSPSDKSNLLLKLVPPEIPWKRGDWVTKAMRCDVIYLGLQHYCNFYLKWDERKIFSVLKYEHILSGAIFSDGSCPCSPLICPFSVFKGGKCLCLETWVHSKCML